MKLLDITYSQAAKPNAMSPSTAIAPAMAKAGAIGKAAQVGIEALDEHYRSQAAKANAEYRETIVGVQTAMAEKDELTRDDLYAFGVDETNRNIRWTDSAGEDVQTFKKYEVEAAIMADVMERQRTRHADTIGSKNYRNAWISSTKESDDKEILRITSRAADEQKKYEYNQAIADAEALTGQAKLEFVQESPELKGNPAVRQRYMNQARLEIFEQNANEVILNGSDQQLEAFISGMSDQDTRTSLPITEKQAITVLNRAKGELDQRKREQARLLADADRLAALAEKERLALAKDVTQDIETAIKAGVEVPDSEWEKAKAITNGTDYEDVVQRMDEMSQFVLLDAETRASALEGAKTFETAADYHAMVQADAQIRKMYSEDGMAVAQRQGLVDLKRMDPSDPAWGVERQRQAEIVSAHAGMPISPLTQSEANTIAQNLPNMTWGQQANMALGFSDMPEVWEQFDKAGAKVFAWAGATGDKEVAQSALRGKQAIDAKLVIPPNKNDYLIDSQEYLGGIYQSRPRDFEALMETTKAIYADIAPTGDEGEYSQDAWIQALEMATGGVGDINGGAVIVPRGTNPDVMQDFVDKFSAEQVAAYGGVDTVQDNEVAAEIIREGIWQSVGKDRYIVMHGNRTLMSDGKPLEITYGERQAMQQSATEYSRSRQTGALMMEYSMGNDEL